MIVNYRTADLTVAAAASAVAAGASEVVIVDNASGDEIRRQVDTPMSPRVRVYVSAENQGFGSAANRGARNASTPFLVFLNSDAVGEGRSQECVLTDIGRDDSQPK